MNLTVGGRTVQIVAHRSTSWFDTVVEALEDRGLRYFIGQACAGADPYRSVIVDTLRRRDDPPLVGVDIAEQMAARRWRYWNCTAASERYWVEASMGEARDLLLDEAMPMLTEVAPALAMADFLTVPDPTGDRAVGVQEAMLRAWWSDRMDEGHTRESAQMLLALTATPGLLPLVGYDADGPHITDTTETTFPTSG